MFASALYQTIDGVFVGRFLGQTAFAAVNLAMPFVIINFSLADLIGVGSAVPISVCLGKKQEKEANNIFTCACLFMADASPEVMSAASGALRLFSLTYITRWFSFAVQSYMLAIEKPVPASVISVSTALVFPLILIVALWPLGLTGIWLNLAGTSLLAGILSAVILLKYRVELSGPDAR